MSDINTKESAEAVSDMIYQDKALLNTLRRLLTPLARLCLAKGITFMTVEEVLKQVFIHEANSLQPGAPEHGMVSRISTATGINRREVTRLTKLKTAEKITKQPLASEILARWVTGHSYRDPDGVPIVLNRIGPAPSFETLAQSITRDIHPRSMLDELIRLSLVRHDENRDMVSLTHNDFVPGNDSQQMLDFLSDNVGDHLDAAVVNVLQSGNNHLEQAVFADELSAESLEALQPLIMDHWKVLREYLVPAITSFIEADKLAGRTQNQRVRIGLYSFTGTTTDSITSHKSQTARRFRKSISKENPK
jgi:hypothetical protein